jgi:hypothetical protein
LQGADHQSEDRESVRPGGLNVGRVQARGDVVDLCHQFVGEDRRVGGQRPRELGDDVAELTGRERVGQAAITYEPLEEAEDADVVLVPPTPSAFVSLQRACPELTVLTQSAPPATEA